jgi:hypothetical protein
MNSLPSQILNEISTFPAGFSHFTFPFLNEFPINIRLRVSAQQSAILLAFSERFTVNKDFVALPTGLLVEFPSFEEVKKNYMMFSIIYFFILVRTLNLPRLIKGGGCSDKSKSDSCYFHQHIVYNKRLKNYLYL